MALQFFNVKLLEYSHTPVLFDAGLRYRVDKQLTIIGQIKDDSNFAGVASLRNKEDQIIDGAIDYEDIYLNGVFFGKGRIINIQFSGGDMTHTEEYTYSIECYEEGNLFNGTSGVYDGLTWNDARRIARLDESFQYRDNEKGERTYTHSINVQFSEYGLPDSGINLAKTLASVFFNATSGLGAFLNEYSNVGSAKRLYSESYNRVDASCSFTETVVIPRDSAGTYSYSLSYQVNLDEEGFVSVSESVKITGLTDPRYTGAIQGFNTLKPNSYSRCAAIYTEYNFSDEPLFSKPISQRVSIDKFRGEISIETSYSNNPKYQTLAIWEYTIQSDRDSQGYYTITESGNVLGIGRPLKDKYKHAQEFYDSDVKTSVQTRCQDFYEQVSSRNLSLLRIKHSLNSDEFKGAIGYSFTYTDNNLYADEAIRRTEIKITTTPPVHQTSKYNIFNQKEMVQPQQQSTLGQKNFEIALKGKRGTVLSTYLTKAKSIASANMPATTDKFIQSCQYSFSPEGNDFNFSLSVIYVGEHKEFTDLSID